MYFIIELMKEPLFSIIQICLNLQAYIKIHRRFLWLLLSYLYITFIYNLLLTGTVCATTNAALLNFLFPSMLHEGTCLYYADNWKEVC